MHSHGSVPKRPQQRHMGQVLQGQLSAHTAPQSEMLAHHYTEARDWEQAVLSLLGLKRQGRVSYGAVKRRFDLDDAYLEDLKGEILFAYPVVDEDGRGLVWTGDPASAQAVVSPLLRPHNSLRPRNRHRRRTHRSRPHPLCPTRHDGSSR